MAEFPLNIFYRRFEFLPKRRITVSAAQQAGTAKSVERRTAGGTGFFRARIAQKGREKIIFARIGIERFVTRRTEKEFFLFPLRFSDVFFGGVFSAVGT